MSLLLKNALIFDHRSAFHNTVCDVFINKGFIESLSGGDADEQIDLQGKMVCPGWFDLSAHFNDPGLEFKEDIASGSRSASEGGFTDVLLIPSTSPPVDSKSAVEYINRRSTGLPDLHINASLSEGLKGENLAEILDLHSAGATSFSEGDKPIWNAELLLKALQYTSSIDVPLFQNARDQNLSKSTHMHEGWMSTNLGLRGEPSLSEELIVMRDLEILKYSGGRLHFSRISCAKSIEMIRKAKEDGLCVTADVGIGHLIFTDQSVGDFDTNYKVLPVFRSEKDRKALIEGIKSGVIDAICSNHRPQDQENKQLEFDLAQPGTISLQSFAPALLMIQNEIPLELLLDKVAHGPRKVLRKNDVVIEEGLPAKLTILDAYKKWILNEENNLSKSRNSPFWGKELTGKVFGTINGEQYSVANI